MEEGPEMGGAWLPKNGVNKNSKIFLTFGCKHDFTCSSMPIVINSSSNHLGILIISEKRTTGRMYTKTWRKANK